MLLSGCGEQGWERNTVRAQSLEELNETCILVEEKAIHIESENNGEAELVVKIPDYEELYQKAYETEDPETYIKESLISGNYTVQTIETNAADVYKRQGQDPGWRIPVGIRHSFADPAFVTGIFPDCSAYHRPR